MGKKKDNLIILEKCLRCKFKKNNLCKGQQAVKGSILKYCPHFIDTRSSIIIDKNENIPYPIK